jgi:hypothetical protein
MNSNEELNGRGEIRHTHHAALQHEIDIPDSDDLVLGVVNTQMYGFSSSVTENDERLSPPEQLLTEFKSVAEEVGHNTAWEEVNFESRFRSYLEQPEAQEALQDVLDTIKNGQTVWLVCYENTDDKRCHRETLVDVISSRLDGDG